MSELSNLYPSLSNKSVFVTGGGSGIGEVIVQEFCRQAAKVTFVDIDTEASNALVQRLAAELGTPPLFVRADVTDIEQLHKAMDQAFDHCVGLDVLVNNAANDERHAIAEVTPDYWDECLNINLRPHFFSMQKAAQLMVPGGSVINMGSIGWMRGRPDIVGYTTAKGAISALTRTMARELGGQSIRVNSVVPGAIVTERQKALWLSPDLDQQFLDMQALKFRLQPNDVAAMVLFLASADSRACSGQNFIVDAGVV